LQQENQIEINYDPEDAAFLALTQAIVLGTYTIFQYDPTDDECKQLFARQKKVAVASLEGVTLDATSQRECRARLKTAEEKLAYIHRHCKGDASETGLVQFAQGVMDLNETRTKFPTHICKDAKGKENECLIPFSSDIKFNAFIRDMSKSGVSGEDGLCIFLKGAPERILVRCSKILIGGQEVDFTDDLRKEVSQANSDFGKLGERVLAFARCHLDAGKYTKDGYNFDTKTWKEWGLDPKQSAADYASKEGSFPMHDLTLVGVVSLNDPPRPKVDLSVNKCRSAGIKVIMVTGDQPPTAAAIA
jgi:sodium/potassium-transporting ATPase subunit alpha